MRMGFKGLKESSSSPNLLRHAATFKFIRVREKTKTKTQLYLFKRLYLLLIVYEVRRTPKLG